jgi:hypothetical protein
MLGQEGSVHFCSLDDKVFSKTGPEELREGVRCTHFRSLGQLHKGCSELRSFDSKNAIIEGQLSEGEPDDSAFADGEDGLGRVDDGGSELFEPSCTGMGNLFDGAKFCDFGIGKVGEVVSGRVVSSCARDDDELDLLIFVCVLDKVFECLVHARGEGVEAGGPIEGDIEPVASDF